MGGISGLLGAIALLGFLGFLGGIALVVLSASQGRPVRSGISLAVVGLLVGLIFSVISQGILILEPTQVGVIVNTLNGNLEAPRRAGTSIVVPVVQTYYIYPINQQEYTMSALGDEGQRGGDDSVDATTVDGQVVNLDVTIFYAIDPLKVNDVHQRWGSTYQGYIRSTARTVIRDVIAKFQAEQIYGASRDDMQLQINDQMREEFASEGFTLNSVDVRGLTFSDQFRQAIEEKIAADQRAQQAAFVVEQRQQEAEQARQVAAGERDANIARAEGEAQSIVLRAQAEAEALRLVSEQIAANPSLIQYLYVQNLSDNVNIALVPANSPFLFDFNSLSAADPDFRAPAAVPEAIVPTAEPTPGS